ncbi:MAG TPA: hypothetical protein VGM93_13840, partial [Acidimicrobiales bacterium]
RSIALPALLLALVVIASSCSSSDKADKATTTTAKPAATTAPAKSTTTTASGDATTTTTDGSTTTAPTGPGAADLVAFCTGFRILNASGNDNGGLDKGLAKARAFYAHAVTESARLAGIAPAAIRSEARALATALVTFRKMILAAKTASEADTKANAKGGPGEAFIDHIIAIGTWTDAHCPAASGYPTTTTTP